VIDWWVERMVALPNPTTVPASIPTVASPNPLQERMTLFWHDHFACSQDKVSDIPAMLVYLDNQSNVVGSEQENYARELMKLHTIGIGEFAENDVIAMARVWTGHNTVGWTGSRWDSTYVYKPDEHDQSVKTLFGITANWNGLVHSAGEREVMAEFIDGVKQRATARFISRKMFRWRDGRVCRSPTWACTGIWKAWVRCC